MKKAIKITLVIAAIITVIILAMPYITFWANEFYDEFIKVHHHRDNYTLSTEEFEETYNVDVSKTFNFEKGTENFVKKANNFVKKTYPTAVLGKCEVRHHEELKAMSFFYHIPKSKTIKSTGRIQLSIINDGNVDMYVYFSDAWLKKDIEQFIGFNLNEELTEKRVINLVKSKKLKEADKKGEFEVAITASEIDWDKVY